MPPSLPPAGDAEPAEALPRQACIPHKGAVTSQARPAPPPPATQPEADGAYRGLLSPLGPQPMMWGVFPGEGGSDLPSYPLQEQAIPFLVFILAESGEGRGGGLKTGRKQAFSLAGREEGGGSRRAHSSRDAASPPWGVGPSHMGSFCLPAEAPRRQEVRGGARDGPLKVASFRITAAVRCLVIPVIGVWCARASSVPGLHARSV